jgi:adenylate cyclase
VPPVVFVIADLAGYTPLTEAHGGDGAATTVARYRDLAERALADGARIVEQVGDELLIVASDARAAMMSAVRIRAAVDAEPRFPGVRIGIADGSVVEREGRYFGPALNLTARLAARPAPTRSSARPRWPRPAGTSTASRCEASGRCASRMCRRRWTSSRC